MLASAVGPNLTKLLHDQLDLMFTCGLSEPLRQALVAIARHIPPLLKTIQGLSFSDACISIAHRNLDRLLDLLSNVLSGQPYKPLGAPAAVARGDINRELPQVRPFFVTALNIKIINHIDHNHGAQS